MSQQSQTNIEALSFEQAYRELEETTQKLEAGNLPLAEALALYQRGMALAKHCGRQLDQAELTIQALSPSGDLADFDEEA
ncbi:MAG: exodeoxyribonuclease VII small subunit [Anaerolineae bacterium]|nr:exodeoxyribonuclease VII small subunit [Anaerolineae bacterium]